MSSKQTSLCFILFFAVLWLMPEPAWASLESSLEGIRSSLLRTILPLLAVIGMGLAAISFFLGSPKAKEHFYLALIGAFIAFGGQALVDWLSTIVN